MPAKRYTVKLSVEERAELKGMTQNRQSDPGADFSKWVSADSLADVIVFLASDGARDITGAAIPVYGKS